MKSPTSLSKLAQSTLIAAALIAPALAQTTYIVDDSGGPGVDFTAIQPALAVAGPLDLVEVRPGSYASFTMSRATRLLGDAGVNVSGTSTITGIAATDWAVVAGFSLDRLAVQNSDGTVILDDLRWRATSRVFSVTNCRDVRGRDLRNLAPQSSTVELMSVFNSAVQLASCTIRCVDAPPNTEGATAVELEGGSYLHLVDTEVRGGRGGDAEPFFGSFAQNGGDGIWSDDDSDTRIVRSDVRGGGGGFDNANPFNDGFPGVGLRACGGTHEVWSSTVAGGSSPGGVYEPGAPFQLGCGAIVDASTPLPSFTQVGPAAPNTPMSLEARAEPLSSGRVIFGRSPVRVAVTGSSTPRLVDVARLASLGAMAPSGLRTLQLNIPAWPRGTVAFLQTSSTTGAGTQMANAVAVVVR